MDKANNKPLGMVLIGIILIAVILYFVTDGALNLKVMSKTRGAHTDKEENMAYNDNYRSLSDNALERDGIILRAEGDELLFYALAGKAPTSDGGTAVEDVQYVLTSIAERSELDIEQVGEYMGYFYMYDGMDVWRIHTTNPELKLTIENAKKFEPMGNYLYSIKDRDGELWLHRCMVTGADEEYMFKESFVDFWAHSGDLLLERPDGSYMWYDVVNKNSFDRSLPADAEDICLYNQVIYYLHDGKLYSSHVLSTNEDVFVDEAIADYCIAEGYCAYITEDGTLNVLSIDDKSLRTYSGMEISADFSVDVSKNSLFITDTDGRTFYCPLDSDTWKEIFNK
ncbi:MAG: hypothetical protein IJB78_05155 [Oscillospiraceae bacterium]|nr:hypothetical protein [Oscillospiraceae bacterium]